MQLMKQLSIFTFFVLLLSCETKEIPVTDPVFDDKRPIAERIELAVNEELLLEMGYSKEFAEVIHDFYKERKFKPVWSNDSTPLASYVRFKHYFSQPQTIGLPRTRIVDKTPKNVVNELVVKEIGMTAKLAQVYHDLHVGFMDTSENKMRPVLPASMETLTTLIAQKDTVKRWDLWFAGMGPDVGDYRLLAKVLFNKLYNKTLSAKKIDIPELKKDTIGCWKKTEEALIEKKYLDKDSANEGTREAALKAFQTAHELKPDGVPGAYTRMLLGESEVHQMDRAVLSLERWRWRSKFPERYIWVNIPEYLLRIYYNDTLFSQHNVVVGKPETKTPQLQSKIRRIIAMPYWTQPQSIAEKEFLPAMQRNLSYAAKNNYKIYRGNKEVDPSSVNWKMYKEKNFPFRITQQPGPNNALGLIKFEFSNSYNVYLHDTPSKNFFRKDIRSYSHGCVRCDLPDSLARFILSRDEKNDIIPDSLDSIIARREHREIFLKKPVFIQIDYITVTVKGTGEMIVHPDIYERDAAYLKWMK